MTELGQGDAGQGNYGGLGGSMTTGPGPTTGNIEDQHGIDADALAWQQAQQEQAETVEDLLRLAQVRGVTVPELGDIERIAASLTVDEMATLAASSELPLRARMKYAYRANSMPTGMSLALPGFMAPIGVAMGVIQTMFTGRVGAAPDPNTDYTGPEKTMTEWLSDPVMLERLQSTVPEEQIGQVRQEFKAQTDRAVASAFVGASTGTGADLDEVSRNQHVDTLVKNWNTGKGGFDKAGEMGTPVWLKNYLTQGTIPDFLTSSATPTPNGVLTQALPAPDDAETALQQNTPPVVEKGLLARREPVNLPSAAPTTTGGLPRTTGLLTANNEDDRMVMRSPT